LHSIGEAEYQNQQYSAAADYYERALNALPKNDREFRSKYLRDAIVAYAESGDLSKAESLIENAKTRDLENVDMLLIQAVLASQKGQENECASYAQQVLDQTTDAQLCARAALAAASVASDPDTELMWLRKAQQYRSNKTVLRALAVANVQLAQENRSDSITHEALLQAYDYYVQLTSDAYPTKTDWINYSIVLMMLDRCDDAVVALERQLAIYPNDYSILMQLAFASNQKGDNLAAANYCRDAIEAWKLDRSPERESLDSENIQNLNSLAQQLGIGGIE